MSNLIKRLRMINPSVSTLYKTRLEAADEIERLQAWKNKHYRTEGGDCPHCEIDRLSDEIERLRSREFEALGWMYAELCNRVNAGEDIGLVEVPELIAAYEALREVSDE